MWIWRLSLGLVTLHLLATQSFAADPTWAFSAPKRPGIPSVREKALVRNPIDAFLLARLEEKGLSLSTPADRAILLRRVRYDLTGLPPTVADQDAFLNDTSPDAYERLVDRLLASPQYGERWAQHWLDLVRFAESDGFKADDLRPAAYRYRDYVIDAFNKDMPYDRFVRQQLAGDELEPDNPQALIATGLNRLYPDEYNAANLEQRRQEILDDVVETNGLVFLGLTIGCARCHDHKFDPILQREHYALQAFFAPMQPRDDLLAVSPAERRRYEEQRAAWEKATAAPRAEMQALISKKRTEQRTHALGKFRQEIQQAVLTPEAKRTPYQELIATIAEKQLVAAEREAPKKLTGDQKKRYEELERQVNVSRPTPPAAVHAIVDLGRDAPPTYLLQGGNWQRPKEEIAPGFPAFLGKDTPDTRVDDRLPSTGRRAALARWLTKPDHPLTARVMANRLWQHHFGTGIVPTPNDFGAQGELATHPELLDWLATELVRNGWSLKHLHRLMVTSAAYRQSSRVSPDNPMHARGEAIDSDNRLLWHARRRRLDGESLRDTILLASGDLNMRQFGPSAKPKLPEGVSKYAWTPDTVASERNRRSIYVMVRRNMRFPLFDVFDLPDLHNSCAVRPRTTTAPQALLLLNGEFVQEQSRRWATNLRQQHGEDIEGLVRTAYQTAWGRAAEEPEIRAGLVFVREQAELLRTKAPNLDNPGQSALVDFCQALLNANETLFVD